MKKSEFTYIIPVKILSLRVMSFTRPCMSPLYVSLSPPAHHVWNRIHHLPLEDTHPLFHPTFCNRSSPVSLDWKAKCYLCLLIFHPLSTSLNALLIALSKCLQIHLNVSRPLLLILWMRLSFSRGGTTMKIVFSPFYFFCHRPHLLESHTS